MQDPRIYGLHENAQVTAMILEADFQLDCLLRMRGSESGSGVVEGQKARLAQTILSQIPEQFDVEAVQQTFGMSYYETMNTVLIQEVLRYNALLQLIKESLLHLIEGLQGLRVLTPILDAIGDSVHSNTIP